jgi:hypothetical protein
LLKNIRIKLKKIYKNEKKKKEGAKLKKEKKRFFRVCSLYWGIGKVNK